MGKFFRFIAFSSLFVAGVSWLGAISAQSDVLAADLKIFDNGVWWITKSDTPDPGIPDPQAPMAVFVNGNDKGNAYKVTFGHLKMAGDYPAAAVIYNSGFVRLTPLGLPFGTSFILGPAHWDSTDRYFHNLQISRIDIDTSSAKPSGALRLTITARDYNATFWPSYHFDITYQITLYDPSVTKAVMDVTQTFTAGANFSISASRQNNHEGFKWAQFSSMYKDSTYHDSDGAHYVNKDNSEQLINPANVTCGIFLFTSPLPLSPRNPWVQSRHGDDVGWPGQGNRPNTIIHLTDPTLALQTVPQGRINFDDIVSTQCKTNENNDNISLWLNDESASLVFSAGQSNTISYTLISQDDPLIPSPAPLLPDNSNPPSTLRPLFDWTSVIGATSYTIQVSTSQNFASFVVNCNATPSAYQPAQTMICNPPQTTSPKELPRNVLLFWRVRANESGNVNGSSAWSRVRHFDSPNPPSQPVLLSPADKAVMLGSMPLLDWPDSAFNPQYYEVQIAADANFTSILGRGQSGRTQTSQYTPEVAMPPGAYYWRVRAVNAQSQFSEWSSPRSFLTTLHGLDFGPFYKTGEDPNRGSTISEDELRKRMKVIAPYTKWVRTFGCGGGLEKAGRIAHELGLKVAIGAWLGKDDTPQGVTANNSQIQCLINLANAGEVDIGVVGSEVLLRGDLTEAKLKNYIDQVQAAVPATVMVTTADTYSQWLGHLALFGAVDTAFVNYYPFWGGYSIGQAIATLNGWHQQIKTAAGSMPVIISETGWPSCGNPKGSAVPSKANARTYLLDFVSWANANNVEYFYFEAFDEGWKINYGDDGLFRVGPCWGIWNNTLVLKPAQ